MLIQRKDKLKYRILTQIPTIKQYDVFSFIGSGNRIERNLTKEIKRFSKTGVDISACPEYLDGLIEKQLDMIRSNIENSHRKNMHIIEEVFDRRKKDQQELSQAVSLLEEQIEAAEIEFKFMKEVFKKHNPFYRGISALINRDKKNTEEEEETDGESF